MYAAVYTVNSSTDTLHGWLNALLFILVVICIIVILWQKVRPFLPQPRESEIPHSPLLFSDTVGADTDIIRGYSGTTPHGLHIEYYVGGLSLFSETTSRGVYTVDLPFMSGVRLIGIPKDHTLPATMADEAMERVELEGNYSDVFQLFANTGEQVASRYVMDPKAMVFTMDFCAQFDWEIVDDSLYFRSESELPGFAIVDQFVEEIRPAVEVPSDRPVNANKRSYTDTLGLTLLCPICQQPLKNGKAWLACPQGHGCLVTGKQLLDMSNQQEPVPFDITASTPHQDLTCPYCSHPMNPTRYQLSKVVIDVCSNCRFRWLDAEEPTRLFGGNR